MNSKNSPAMLVLAGILILVLAAGAGYLLFGGENAPIKPKETTAPGTAAPSTADENSVRSTAASSTAPGTTAGSTAGTTAGTTKPDTTADSTTAKPADPNDPAAYAQTYAYAGFTPAIAAMSTDKWYLLLVNGSHVLPQGYTPKLTPCYPGSNISLDERVAPHYTEMHQAAKKDGITLVPISGYRSFTRQKNNFENKIRYYQGKGYSKAQATRLAAESIMLPGGSEHNAGFAMDICDAQYKHNLSGSFAQTKEYKWLAEHAADYGFIERYTEAKKPITKVIPEPWHWRYVGAEDAKKIKASGQSLEEYLGIMD